ncbi:MAG: mucoidy inhibitor MuiA family protein [Bauldia sp.]
MRSPILPILATLPLLFVGFGPAMAADVEAKSKIDAVIVYPDAAGVTRLATVNLPSGISTLVFKGLPTAIDPASLRVEGAGTRRLSLGSVESRVVPAAAPPPDSAIDAQLAKLRADREAVQAEIDALEAKKAMIVAYSQAGPDKLARDPNARPLDIAQWSTAWDAVGQGLAKVGDELRLARAKARDLDTQIRDLDRLRQRPAPQTTASRDVTVEIDSEAAQEGRFSLSYRVAGAGWAPVYDARLDTNAAGGRASLELVRRADVTQRTGEDWSGVALSVSTVRARRSTQAPEVLTQRLAFPELPAIGLAKSTAAPPPPVAAAPAARADNFRAEAGRVDELQVAQEQQATLDANSFQAAFDIPGRVDIPADGSRKSFRIATSRLTPELLVRASPALDDTAYLQARIKNEEEAPLLAGTVNILRDGGFVGTGRIAFTATGDTTDLGFGADDRVKVTRVPVRRKENEPTIFGSTKTEQREFRTTIKNLHPFAIKVSVVDQIPISENSAIVIDQLPATTPPTEKIVNDRRGVMGWTFDLQPGETKALTLAYRMRWPADRAIVIQTVP